eukprot:TRINITY_DN56057_c0_g1_i1.p1 TRINITY_DN56057_c0_g1~~TRINITY_DN56057_c0_g1_i1.p1  ORF type:complete len:635 (-),score=33.76 TRINITY_DN56057_c0_g1_i1:97-2001(-)
MQDAAPTAEFGRRISHSDVRFFVEAATATSLPFPATADPLQPTGQRRRRLLHALASPAAWTSFATLSSTPFFIAPGMLHRPSDCVQKAWFKPAEYAVWIHILALGLAAVYKNQGDGTSRTSRWIRRYAVSFFVHNASYLVLHWLMIVCPDVSSNTMADLDRVLSNVGTHGSYALGQFCLGMVSVMRLQWVGQTHAASQAVLLAKFALICFAFMVLLNVINRALNSWICRVLADSLGFMLFMLYFAFQIRVFVALRQASRSALAEARVTGQHSEQAKAALLTAHAVAMSSSTTVAFTAVIVVGYFVRVPLLLPQGWLFRIMAWVDLSTDVLLAIVCSGMLTQAADQERNFQIAGQLVEADRRRKVLSAMKEAARAVAGPSVALAALFEGRHPEDLLQIAVERFRCISWDTLRRHPYLITSSGSLDGASVSKHMYELSEACQLAGCDAFLSHSWHDDPLEKWKSLEKWCTWFSGAYGRSPRLWFDKVCIDQTNIQTDLQCLPIFIAGCNNLLVSCGRTYTTRLWCCVELFVFMKMSEGVDRHIHVIRTGNDDGTADQVTEAWTNFDVQECRCFKADDKTRILECIEKDGGVEVFNAYIRSLASDMFQEPSPRQERQHDATVAAESTAHVADDGASI